MTYGTMHDKTREWILRRANESAIPYAKLQLDVEFDEVTGDPITEGKPYTEVVEIATIFDGALDETFYCGHLYAVNIADWIAEQCNEEYQHSRSGMGWDVIVTEYSADDAGPQVYRVTSDTHEG